MTRKVRKKTSICRDQEERLAEQTGALGSPDLNDELWERAVAYMEAVIGEGPVPGGRTWRREDLYDDCDAS